MLDATITNSSYQIRELNRTGYSQKKALLHLQARCIHRHSFCSWSGSLRSGKTGSLIHLISLSSTNLSLKVKTRKYLTRWCCSSLVLCILREWWGRCLFCTRWPKSGLIEAEFEWSSCSTLQGLQELYNRKFRKNFFSLIWSSNITPVESSKAQRHLKLE